MKLERRGWHSVLVNVLLACLHGLIARVSGSLPVFAELVHNPIDRLGAVTVQLVGHSVWNLSGNWPPGGRARPSLR